MTDPILDAARELMTLAEKATPGPWRVNHYLGGPYDKAISTLCRALISRTEALHGLVKRLDRGPYCGPSYAAELEAARRALADEVCRTGG